MDEAACYLTPLLSLTWAPIGQTPLLIEQSGREHLSLIAAIAPNGRIYLAGQDQAFTGEDIVWFLQKLCGRYRKRDLLVIWDGASIHRSEAVKSFLSQRPGRVYLAQLPAYSPELNLTELVWSQLKRSMQNQVLLRLEELAEVVVNQAGCLENNPALIRAFFEKKKVAFFTD